MSVKWSFFWLFIFRTTLNRRPGILYCYALLCLHFFIWIHCWSLSIENKGVLGIQVLLACKTIQYKLFADQTKDRCNYWSFVHRTSLVRFISKRNISIYSWLSCTFRNLLLYRSLFFERKKSITWQIIFCKTCKPKSELVLRVYFSVMKKRAELRVYLLWLLYLKRRSMK